MKVSISMYSLASAVEKEGWSVSDFIGYAAGIGLDGVELLDFYWKDETEIGEALSALEKHGLSVSAYDVTNNFVKENAQERKAEAEKVKDGIRTAEKLGTNIVRVFCGDLAEGLTYEDGQDWTVEGLKSCAGAAEEAGVFLAIENHGLLAGKSAQVEEIIRKVGSPNVKATFDTGNFLLVHENPVEAFEMLKEDVVHVHFKDFREKTADDEKDGFRSTEGKELIGTVPGDGMVDLSAITGGLKTIGYEGWLSVEYEGQEDAKAANEEAVRRLRRLILEEG